VDFNKQIMRQNRKHNGDLSNKYIVPGSTWQIALLAFYMIVSQSIRLGAQPQSQPQSDSLFHFIEIAIKNNPSLKQKFYEYHASLKRIPQAGSLPDPEVSLGVFLTPMELVSGKQVADIRLMQMFPWFGVLKNAKDEMSYMANAKYELFEDSKLQLIYDVQREWYEIYKIQNKIRVTEMSLDILKNIEQLAMSRFSTSSVRSVNSGSLETSGNTSIDNNRKTSGSTSMQNMGNNSDANGSARNAGSGTGMNSGPMSGISSGTGLADVYRIQIEIGDLNNDLFELKEQEKKEAAVFNSYLNRSV
jgi:hypothetical protein